MDKKHKTFKVVDILGIIAYALMAASCFLPFLNYTNFTNTETITYFQSNGKMVLAFSLLAIIVIIIKKFKYTFICLGLSIGIYAYDIIFGLLAVVRQKTTVYSLRYGFYLLAVGMFISLVYIFLKKKSLDREYEKQFEVVNMPDDITSEIDLNEVADSDVGITNSDTIQNSNPQIQLLDGYQFNKQELDEEHIPSDTVIENEKLFIEETAPIEEKELSFDDIDLLESPDETYNNEAEEIRPSLGEVLEPIEDVRDENIVETPISIFNEIPNMDIRDTDGLNTENIQPIKRKETKSPYKLCDRCGMQIDSEAEQCPVCGKYF